MKELLTDLLEYMESRADADIEGPNKEMGFQIRIEEALAELSMEALKPSEAEDKVWICNECNFPNFTQSVSEDEIDAEVLSCINCGGFEFHLGKKIARLGK